MDNGHYRSARHVLKVFAANSRHIEDAIKTGCLSRGRRGIGSLLDVDIIGVINPGTFDTARKRAAGEFLRVFPSWLKPSQLVSKLVSFGTSEALRGSQVVGFQNSSDGEGFAEP
jgi:hypothetical protein